MRRIRSIPDVTTVKDPAAAAALSATKEVIEHITGRSSNRLSPMPVPSTATEAERAIILKLNDLINRLQA